MDKKIRLGLSLFFSNSSNSGIVNYIYNIISALKTLPDEDRPTVIVFYSENAPKDYLKEIGYSDIKFILYKHHSSSRIIRGINKVIRKLTGHDFYQKIKYLNKIDIVYPYFEFMDNHFKYVKHKIHWLVDFNNRAYPLHYADNGKLMTTFQESLIKRTEHVVLSSNALLKEMKLYYPDFKNYISILRFACTLPDISSINIRNIKKKYGISKPYFMSPNQFWEHKNQLLLIEALHILQGSSTTDFQIIFTGSMEVNRGKGNILDKLLHKVKEYKLEEAVTFLGVIDRNEQLALMKHSKALIQPSLYEGWSTLVEEAKALNQKIILSDLPVHQEQACVNSYFFDPHDATTLARQMSKVISETTPAKQIEYSCNVYEFADNILAVLKHEISKK